MPELIEHLAWDSEFFDLSIGRVLPLSLDETEVRQLLAEAQNRGLHCLYFQADPNDPATVAIVERHGFHLVDVRVVLEHPFDDRPAPVPRFPVPQALIIDAPAAADLPALREIALQISLTSRFDFDRNFTADQSRRLYRRWIENACNGYADIVRVARWRPGGEPVGLISCILRDATAHIQLAGVHFDHRKQSVGTGLVQAALDWARASEAHAMQVVTQARNVPAQRLYQQLGFFTRSMSLYYHKWF